ncbi:hypothetical protein V6R21_15170 [Limibacter armeniacum]|uniref:hypothetical protein n=1 Tax=Limibacter armeniacum TaxID=466084 RepID=UPI002FE6BE26
MKKFFRRLFGSRYEVVFRMYHVIPGMPVKPTEKRFSFEKGEKEEAEDFFSKVVTSTNEHRVAPSEVVLFKAGKAFRTETFGPVEEIKKDFVA